MMGSDVLDKAKELACCNEACWRRERFTDAGIAVELGSGWQAFMLDRHFADKHKCVGRRGRRGELCDAIAIHEQDKNCRLRLIEAKRGGMSAKTARQLQNGAAYLEKVAEGCDKTPRVSAEVHTASAVEVTAKRRDYVELRGARIPIRVF